MAWSTYQKFGGSNNKPCPILTESVEDNSNQDRQ